MVTDSISSFFSNIRQKTTNPFLGTLIIVWSICNWELLYSFFTFDSFMTLDARVARVKAYIASHEMFWNLVGCIFESILVLIFTYLFLNASRGIVNVFENRLTPWVYLKTKPKSIVTIDLHNSVVIERDRWANLYDKERTEKLRIQTDIEDLNKIHNKKESDLLQEGRNLKTESIERLKDNENLKTQILNYERENQELKILVENIKGELKIRNNNSDTENKKLRKDNEELSKRLNNSSLTFETKSNKVYGLNEMISISREINNSFGGELMSLINLSQVNSQFMLPSFQENFINYCLNKEIIEFIFQKVGQENSLYRLTEYGKKLLEIIIVFRKNNIY